MELHNEIKKIYESIRKDIAKAIKGYKNAWKGKEEEVFAEIAFCILTPQSKARNAWKAINILVENRLLYEGEAEEIAEYLNIVRFKNNFLPLFFRYCSIVHFFIKPYKYKFFLFI